MNDINNLYQELVDARENFSSIIPDLFGRASTLHRDGIQNLFMKILSNLKISALEFETLINLGADPTDGNFYAFDMVAMTNNFELVQYILHNYDINLIDHQVSLTDCINGMKCDTFKLVYPDAESITNPIIRNCLNDLEKVKLLVSYGIDVEKIIDICGEVQRCFSISHSLCETKKYLIETLVKKSFIVTPNNENLYLILKNMILSGLLEKKLIEQLDLLGFNFKQNELLNNACQHKNNLEIISFFINEGYYDGNDGSALETAIRTREKDIAVLLLDNNIMITDKAIENAFIRMDLLILLHKKGVGPDKFADIFRKYLYQNLYAPLPILNFLAENGVDLNSLVLDCQ